MRSNRSGIVALAILLGTTALVPAARAEVLKADTPVTTASGNGFNAPIAWDSTASGKMAKLMAPEGDLQVAVIDVGAAPDAKAALAAAWAIFGLDTKHPLKLTTAMSPRNGWDEGVSADYETSPNEHLAIGAVALRKANAWTVLIERGSEATAEKRGAAVRLVMQSLRPKGFAKETFTGRVAHPLDAARVEAMRTFLADAIKTLGVPGAGFALIENGKVVYEGGVGVKEVGKSDPVDAHTLFMIASNTKGMSTLLLSELVDEDKLKWDQKVVEVYPAFRLGSDATTKSVEVKHLVCACTGLPRKDFGWLFNSPRNTPATKTFTELAGTEPTSRFGEVYQYNNLMASAAGFIGGHLVYPALDLGAAYDKAMQDRIFTPLGMNETTFSMEKALTGNYAKPHGDSIDGVPSQAEMDFNYSIMPYRPAGGAWSSAHDMIRYVALELSKGVLPDGKRLVSEANLLKRRERGVPVGEDHWYGMGLEDDATWGVSIIHHGGSMAGYKSDIVAIPEAGVGAVILTNADNGQALLRPFRRRLMEILYDGKPEAAGDVVASAATSKAAIAKECERLEAPANAAAVKALAPVYENADLGRLRVEAGAKPLRFHFTHWGSPMATRKNDDGTISFVTIGPAVDGIPFVAGTKDGKRTLTTREGQHEYVFVETAP